MVEYEIEQGFYKKRAYKSGPWIPVRIWLEDGDRDAETKELLSDQKFKAEINEDIKNPFNWHEIEPFQENNMYWKKITKEEFKWIILLKTM